MPRRGGAGDANALLVRVERRHVDAARDENVSRHVADRLPSRERARGGGVGRRGGVSSGQVAERDEV
jgi:hypothetical protein